MSAADCPEGGTRRRHRTRGRRRRPGAGGVCAAARCRARSPVASQGRASWRCCGAGEDGWSGEDWRAFFDERAGIAEFSGGVSRKEAEAHAFACCVVEWLNRHPAPSPPGRCAWCGESGDARRHRLAFRHRAKPPHVAARRMLAELASRTTGRSDRDAKRNGHRGREYE